MRRFAKFAVAMALLMSSSLPAQPNRGGRGGFGVPPAGSMLKNFKLYDDQGKDFELASLRGNYTVLVFGCLT